MVRVAWVMGTLAALAVLGVAVVAAVHDPARALVLRGEHLAVTLPGEGWSLAGSDEAVQYADPAGRVVARLRGPAVYREGVCPGTSRAFVGFPSPSSAWPAAAHAALVARWASAVAGEPAGGVPPVERSDGRLRSDVTVSVPDGPCAPARARVSVVSVAVAGGTASVVLVRDLDVEGALGEAAAEAILASVGRDARGRQSLRSRT